MLHLWLSSCRICTARELPQRSSQAHTLQLWVCSLYPACCSHLLRFTEEQNILFARFSFVCPVPAQGEYSYISFLFCSEIGSDCSWLCSIAGNVEDIRLLRSLILNTTCQEKYVGSHQPSTGGCRMHQQENQTKHEVKFIWKGKGLLYHPSAVFKLLVSTQKAFSCPSGFFLNMQTMVNWFSELQLSLQSVGAVGACYLWKSSQCLLTCRSSSQTRSVRVVKA